MKKTLLSACTLVAASTALCQQFSFETIQHPAGSSTYVTSVSGSTVIGYYQNAGSSNCYGFIFNNGTFSTLANAIGPAQTSVITSLQPLGISGNKIVGGDLYTVGGTPGLGFIYDINSGSYTLMPQGFGGTGMKPTGISNNLIVGYAGQILPPGYQWRKHSFTYDGTNYSAQLDFPDPLSLYEGIALSTQAQATNGTTVVGSYLVSDYNPSGSNYNYHGFTLTSGVWTSLNAPGAFNTYAQGISDSNIVGYFNDLLGVHGYVYNGSTFSILDVPGATETRATGISGDIIVGTFVDSAGVTRGFSTSIPVAEITNTIDQSDLRVMASKHLVFNHGTLAPTNSIIINAPISVVPSSTGTLAPTTGTILVNSTPILGQNSTLILNGGTETSTILSAGLSGAGLLVVSSGNNYINGVNSSSGTNVSGGRLTVQSTTALPANNNFATGGSIILSGQYGISNAFTQDFTLGGFGYESKGSLIIGTQSQIGPVQVNGAINLTNNAAIGIEGPLNSVRRISGQIQSATPGAQLSIITHGTASLTISSTIGTNISQINKLGAGSVYADSLFSFVGLLAIGEGNITLNNPSGLSQANTAIRGGSLTLLGPTGQTSSPYALNIELGSETTSELILGDAASASSVSLSGSIIATGSSARITSQGSSSTHEISSSITSSAPGTTLSISTSLGSFLTLDSNISGGIESVNITGPGKVIINGEIAGAITQNNGELIITPHGSIGIAGNNFIDTSLTIESATGSGRIFTSGLSITGNGPTGTALTLGSPTNNSTITLTGNLNFLSSCSIRTPIAGETSVNISGSINASGQELLIYVSPHSSITTLNTLSTSKVDKIGEGTLTISGSASGNFDINAGTLKVNGALSGNVVISTTAKLKGAGVIAGNVTNYGTIAPGNSPGILQIIGSYTALPGSFYEAEIAGNGVAGAANGHDSILVTGTPGTFTIQNGAGLKALKLNGFEPAKGDSFRIINSPGGIFGSFSSFTSQFNQWVIFDKSTGYLYGTGLAPGQTFADYSSSLGLTIWQHSVSELSNDATNGHAGVIDSSTPWGGAALSLLKGTPLPGSFDASPFSSIGLSTNLEQRSDFHSALDVLQSRRFERAFLPKTSWVGFIEYNSIKSSYQTTRIASSGTTVGMLCDVNPYSTIGFGVSGHDSDITFANGFGDANGRSYALLAFASTMLDKSVGRTYFDAGITLGNTSVDSRRTTFLSQPRSNVRTENIGSFARIGVAAMVSESVSSVSFVGLEFTHTRLPSFSEQGDITALEVASSSNESMQLQVGTDLNWTQKLSAGWSRISLGAEAHFEALSGNTYNIKYNYKGSPEQSAYGRLSPRAGIRLTPRVEFNQGAHSSYYLNAAFEIAGNLSESSINLGYKFKY